MEMLHGVPWDDSCSTGTMNVLRLTRAVDKRGGPTTGLVSGATYKIVARHSNKVVDVPGGQNENNLQLQQWSDLGGNPQKWVLTSIGSGNYTLTSVNSPDKVIEHSQRYHHQWGSGSTHEQSEHNRSAF